jgi:hypothetical protein
MLAMRRALVAAMVVAGTLAACNAVLGIEEQAARPVPEEAGDASEASAVRPAFEACVRDVDCVAPNGCYTPHCDTVLGACTYALCEAKDRTCARGICNTTTFACSDALPYGFLAASYDVGGVTSGCGPKPEACVAAVVPFLFLGTRDDVVAVRADDLRAASDVKVAVTGLTTKPQQVIASGRRIWVLGAVQGTVPPYQLPIASIDVPSDPTVTEIHAQTVLVAYPFPRAVGFPAPKGALFVAYDDASQGSPVALVQAPVTDTMLAVASAASAADGGAIDDAGPLGPGTTPMIRVPGVPAGASMVASSGGRVVLWRYPSTFNLVAAAGTRMAAVQADLPLNAPFASVYGPSTTSFAQGPDGTVMVAGPVGADSPADCNCTTHARLQYVFPNAIATATDVNQTLDPEVWVNPGPPVPCAARTCAASYEGRRFLATWLDRRTALTAAPASNPLGARNVTDVRLLGRDPFEANPKRRFTTKVTDTPKGELGVDRVALTSSNGLGYLVIADAQGNNVSLAIVDPACDGVMGP